MTRRLLTRLLDFLNSDRAKSRWGRWKGVRCVIGYSIWFFRFRGLYPSIRPSRSSHNGKDAR